eukprot:CAMPEP_0170172770 /NCGR_PEP_ID=MMETSP0040_2-20121228/6031_1 /TAXON_ID=641309 /ORGANISM="Lotharella oceanica, Strain CCMP622" /LENGTH=456 /DNA_ID=CAMNT_0010413599 /DNA_START=68 /DNA_END=1438 /DNA_ORIENTATION=+
MATKVIARPIHPPAEFKSAASPAPPPPEPRRSGWFRSREDQAEDAERRLLVGENPASTDGVMAGLQSAGVKSKFVSRMVPCGTDAKTGKPIFMNTLIFESKKPLRGRTKKTAMTKAPLRGESKDDDSGGDDDPEAQLEIPVVMGHGWGSGLGLFYRNFDAVASIPGVRLYAIDWLGMGRSSRCTFPKACFRGLQPSNNCGLNSEEAKKTRTAEAREHDLRQVRRAENFFIDALEKWRESLGLSKMILFGHSLGGYLSTVYSIRHPERVSRLLLCSPVGMPKPPADLDERAMSTWRGRTFRWLWETTTPQSVLRGLGWVGRKMVNKFVWGRWADLEDIEEQELEKIAAYLHTISVLPQSGELASNSILRFGAYARNPLGDRFRAGEVKAPTCFIYGERDWMSPDTATALIRGGQKNVVSCHVVANGGHNMFLDNPVAFNSILRKEILSHFAHAHFLQ